MGAVVVVVSGITHIVLCSKPQSHVFVFLKIKGSFFAIYGRSTQKYINISQEENDNKYGTDILHVFVGN